MEAKEEVKPKVEDAGFVSMFSETSTETAVICSDSKCKVDLNVSANVPWPTGHVSCEEVWNREAAGGIYGRKTLHGATYSLSIDWRCGSTWLQPFVGNRARGRSSC